MSGSFREVRHGWPEFRGPYRLGNSPCTRGQCKLGRRTQKQYGLGLPGKATPLLSSGKDLLFTIEQVGEKECLIARKLQSGEEVWRG